MRNYGINYDTGLTADGSSTRQRFDDMVVRRELQIIASDLHATAVRVSGDDPQRIARAGEHALAAGLELWFSPVPINLEPGALPGYFARCAHEAERLRRAAEGRVVLVLGCEISLWCAGFFPGDSVSCAPPGKSSPGPSPTRPGRGKPAPAPHRPASRS